MNNMFALLPIQNDRDTEYVTTPPPVSDLEILSMMDEHGVNFYRNPPDSSGEILYLLLTTVLPLVIMVGAMVFLMRGIALAKEKYGLPEKEPITFTNFIR